MMFETFHLSPKVIGTLAGLFAFVAALGVIGKVPLSYNVRNLLVRWRITFLTALAFTLVVSLLTVMLAFVNGMERLTASSGQPGNVMILSDGATDELFSNLAKSDTTNIERQKGVETTDLNGQKVPLCSKEVYLVVNQQIPPLEGPAGSPEIKGKITSVTADRGAFVVTDEDGKNTSFQIAPGALININVLKVDEKVVVAYEKEGGKLTAKEVRGSNRRRFVQLRGVEDARISSRVHAMELFADGQWFSDAGVGTLDSKASVKSTLPPVQVVLGEGVARVLGQDKKKDRLEVGDTFELGPRKWIVTGIMKSAGSTFGSEIWAKHSVVGPMFGKDQFTCLVARTENAESAKTLSEFLRKDYRPAVRAEPETEYYAKLSETNKQFTYAIYFVTIIMAIGGVFGVMNTMFAAISQRTKDIGVLRILGFSRWQILVSFFLETLVIALVGGIIGCLIGSLSDGWTATSIVSGGQGGGKTVVLRLVVDANTIAIGLLFTIVMGALGGLVPSLSAMRLRPLESLR
jgi:ABC-type antimicrobial peptide transport system permease subunit